MLDIYGIQGLHGVPALVLLILAGLAALSVAGLIGTVVWVAIVESLKDLKARRKPDMKKITLAMFLLAAAAVASAVPVGHAEAGCHYSWWCR